MKRLFCVVCLLFCGLANAASLDEVLKQVRAASGGHAWDHVRQLELRGSLSVGTLTGSIREIDSLVDDRSVTEFDLKVTAGSQGTGNGVSWQSTSTGLVDVDSTDAARATAITDAFLSTRSLLKQDTHRFQTQLRQEPDFEVVSVTPLGGHTIEFWINAQSHRVDRISVPSMKRLTMFADYRDTHGLMLPYRIESHDVDDVQTIAVESYILSSVLDEAHLRRPHSVVHDVELSAKVTLPAHVENGHVYLRASIDGAPSSLFVLDTGAGANVLTPAAAKTFRLASQGEVNANGVGEDRASAGLTRVKELRVGAATFHDQMFAVVPLPALEVHGVDGVESAVGLLGYDFFRRLRVTIDYDDSAVTLEPLQACDTRPTNSTPITVGSNHVPLVPMSIDGIGALWSLDVGDAGSLTLSRKVAQRLGVPSDAGVVTVTEGGVGGVSRERLLQLDEASIGPFKLAKPVVAISDQQAGEFARPNFGGNLGYGVLRNFRVGLATSAERWRSHRRAPSASRCPTTDLARPGSGMRWVS
jgi:predicted aspartyl protease